MDPAEFRFCVQKQTTAFRFGILKLSMQAVAFRVLFTIWGIVPHIGQTEAYNGLLCTKYEQRAEGTDEANPRLFNIYIWPNPSVQRSQADQHHGINYMTYFSLS